jgi:hypothetical protein
MVVTSWSPLRSGFAEVEDNAGAESEIVLVAIHAVVKQGEKVVRLKETDGHVVRQAEVEATACGHGERSRGVDVQLIRSQIPRGMRGSHIDSHGGSFTAPKAEQWLCECRFHWWR